MYQPLFVCTKCLCNFPQSEMSKSGQTCKGCNPHHATFKQCEYCKSDFRNFIDGPICPRCQSLKTRYGEPQSCSICLLKTAFSTAIVCQRCVHYRNRFGEPRQCQNCGNTCAFLKDTKSREKVDGQILCWVCTYNFKLLNRSRKTTTSDPAKRSLTKSQDRKSETVKRGRVDDYHHNQSCRNNNDLHTNNNQQPNQTNQTSHGMDSVYNEQLLTIGQLQDEVKLLKRQLVQKDSDLLAKDRTIAQLKSEMIEMKDVLEDRLLKSKAASQLEQDRLGSLVRQLQKEKVALNRSVKRKSIQSVGSSNNLQLRHSASAACLFTPDPLMPASFSATPNSKHSNTNNNNSNNSNNNTNGSNASNGSCSSVLSLSHKHGTNVNTTTSNQSSGYASLADVKKSESPDPSLLTRTSTSLSGNEDDEDVDDDDDDLDDENEYHGESKERISSDLFNGAQHRSGLKTNQ